MPIYPYRCESCGYSKDILQKISDAALTQCPNCNAQSFSKQLSAPAFQLKGSGWYVTDFRDGKKPESDQKAKGEAAGEASSAGGNKDSTVKDSAANGSATKSGDASQSGKESTSTAASSTPAPATAVASPPSQTTPASTGGTK